MPSDTTAGSAHESTCSFGPTMRVRLLRTWRHSENLEGITIIGVEGPDADILVTADVKTALRYSPDEKVVCP
jgi:hypothetical protein